MNTYDIEIKSFNSAGIRAVAKHEGITHMRHLGSGYLPGHEGQSDYRLDFYALPNPKGWEFKVANTNGDPIWEEEDPENFKELLKVMSPNLTEATDNEG